VVQKVGKMKTSILVAFYYSVSVCILFVCLAGIHMGLEHLLNTYVAFGFASFYIVTLGRYRLRYALIPGCIGMLVDVGVIKTLFYFALPEVVLLMIASAFAAYTSSFIVGNRKGLQPDFDLGALANAITRFHLGADHDARELGTKFSQIKKVI
jgi:hypothetical protein